MKYEVYENNGGGLYLCIISEGGECLKIFENWEYGPNGILADAIQEFEADNTVYKTWNGDFVKRLEEVVGIELIAHSLYEQGLGELIADSNGYRNSTMGFAGRKALNYKED